MVYIVTEDSGAGLKFWEEIANLSEVEVKVTTSKGIRRLRDKVASMNIGKDDIIILAIDKAMSDREVFDIMSSVGKRIEIKGAQYVLVNAY
jgi:fructose-specific phosphotransferase system component IIB